jgi:hypothetical protein
LLRHPVVAPVEPPLDVVRVEEVVVLGEVCTEMLGVVVRSAGRGVRLYFAEVNGQVLRLDDAD